MTTLEFKDFRFKLEDDELIVTFLKNFYFKIPVDELNKIGKFTVSENKIVFDSDSDKVENKFHFLIDKYMVDLRNKVYDKKAVYVHRNSGIPLIGYNSFGLIDRNTNIIEIRPVTGCNLNCIYCSVDEGKDSKKEYDFVVEKDYLVSEFKRLVEYKDCGVIEAHIGTQGEPMLYGDIIGLIEDLSKIDNVKTISIDTNSTLLSKEVVDELVTAGLTRLNISINSLDPKKASEIAGAPYDVEKVKEVIKYAATKLNLIIAPVWLCGINDKDIEDIIVFVKEIIDGIGDVKDIVFGIQNFLSYKGGRNPVKEVKWEKFREWLMELEKKYDVKLILSEEDFNIVKTKKLEKPFKKNDVVEAVIVGYGRYKDERIAAAKGRAISVKSCDKDIGKKVKVRILRDKHNIFNAI